MNDRWRPVNGKVRCYNVNVSIPYVAVQEDGSTTRNWAHLTFAAPKGERIDRRRVKREIRKWVKHNLERTLSTFELLMIMKRTTRPSFR